MPLRHFVLLPFIAVVSIEAATLTLTSSPNPSVYGRQVTLTATVSPAGATGKVTFYDGVNIVGVSAISGTTATLNTITLPSGTRSLRAYYWGDATNTAASSALLAHTVSAVSSLGLRRPVNSRPVDFIGYYSSSAVADVNRDGNLDVILAGSYLTVLLGNGSGGFTLALNRSLFYSVQSLAVSDWNSDGRPDIAYGVSSGNASVALGNGDGTFQNGVPVDTGSTADVLATGDWNRDGKADLVAGSTFGSTDLRVYLGNGDGSFQQPALIPATAFATYVIRVDDFDKDGKPDLVFTKGLGIGIALGNGDGTFRVSSSTYGFGYFSNRFSSGDLTGDGNADLVASSFGGNLVLPGFGNGAFATRPEATSSFPDSAQYVTLADFNGDGFLDALQGSDTRAFKTLINKGDGTFIGSVEYPSRTAGPPAVGDFDNDGRVDVVAVNILDSSVQVFIGGGAPDLTVRMDALGGFTQSQPGTYRIVVTNSGEGATAGMVTVSPLLPAGFSATAISGSGWSCTLATLSCTRSDLLGLGASFPNILITVVSSAAAGAAAASATVSGGSDSVTTNNTFFYTANVGALTTLVLTSSPSPSTLGQSVTLTATLGAADTGSGRVAFYDGTELLGYAPLAASRQATFTTSRLSGGSRSLTARYSGGSTYGPVVSAVRSHTVGVTPANLPTSAASATVPGGMTFIKPGDFNNDGRADLIASGLRVTNVLLGKTDGTFQSPLAVLQDMLILELAVGDFNQDGNQDLVVWRSAGIDLALELLPGNGDGSFRSAVALPLTSFDGTLSATSRLVASDVNRDGVLDLVALDNRGKVVVWLGNGDGTFQIVNTPVPDYVGIDLADLNGDGKPDIVLSELANATRIHVFLGKGDGSFASTGTTFAGVTDFALAGIALGDFNGDGRVDVLQITPNRLAFFAGNGDGTLRDRVETFPTVSFPVSSTGFTVGDFNGDGKLDFSLVVDSPGQVLIAYGLGNGTFPVINPLPVTTPHGRIVPGDFNSDGRPDFAIATFQNFTASGSIQVYLGSAQAPSYVGNIDTATCEVGIRGWVADRNRLNQPITVTLWDGDRLVASMVANGVRTDVATLLGDNGLHGFTFPILSSIADGVSRSLQVRFELSNTQLGSSPVTIKCGTSAPTPNYTGYVDNFSCSTGIAGWAADRNRLNQSINVTLWDGNTQIASTYANGTRLDVATLLGDNGQHGFTLPIPQAYADGVSRDLQVRYDSSASQLPASPVTVKCGSAPPVVTPNYAGYVDVVSCATGISGWAADRNRLNQSINVTLWDGSTQIASAVANAARTDVGGLLGDNGLHGFTIPIPPAYADGVSRNLQIRFETSATQLPASPATVKCGGGPPPSTPNYAGYVDAVSCATGITGWAADRNRLNQAITVTLWDGGTQVASTVANAARPDVGGVLGDNGLHGFTIPIPPAYADGVSRNLQIRYETSTTELPGSPAAVKCGGGPPVSTPNYTGYVDAVSCATGITGWAADRNRLNQSITVSLWDGSTQVASAVANASRPDVGGLLGDNGLHGFTIPIPSAYANGTSRTLQLRFESSATQLNSSPVTFTCGSSGGGGTPNFAGWTDAVSCDAIAGWAADRNRLNQSIPVDLVEGPTVLLTALANVLRPDVGAVLGDNGLHGFTITTPSALKDGAVHNIQLRYSGTAAVVPNSSQTLQCTSPGGGVTPNYTGYVDQMGCSVISGWVADRNRLNTVVDLQVYDGATLLGTTTAGQSRPDVGSYLGDNGLHGFFFPTPLLLKDGQPHTITMRPAGSATVIPGPQALTCP